MRTAVILLNLGGPTSPEAVRPFLFNLFNDPAIVRLPNPFRFLLAWLMSTRRTPVAQKIYKQLGGKSPLLENTQAQARALQKVLPKTHKVFIAMRYWIPRARETVQKLREFDPQEIVLLPLYPQFSTVTTGSSFMEMKALLGKDIPVREIKNYPTEEGFVASVALLIKNSLKHIDPSKPYRLLLSAHGLPQRIVDQGDPYPQYVQETAEAVVKKIGVKGLEYTVCYQSRVGPLRWIGPSTQEEIKRAGRDGMQVVVVPIAFVSEHSETLVELDIEYKKIAQESGVPLYVRTPTVSCHPLFIEGLRDLVLQIKENHKD
jgi:ferrochelatase